MILYRICDFRKFQDFFSTRHLTLRNFGPVVEIFLFRAPWLPPILERRSQTEKPSRERAKIFFGAYFRARASAASVAPPASSLCRFVRLRKTCRKHRFRYVSATVSDGSSSSGWVWALHLDDSGPPWASNILGSGSSMPVWFCLLHCWGLGLL